MRLIHALALVGVALLVPIGNPGCSKYGEGSICDPDNTDPQTGISDDCEDGLLCTTGLCADARGICCPPPGHNITSPACEGMCGNSTGGNNAGGMMGLGGFGGGTVTKCPHDECTMGQPLVDGTNPVMSGGATAMPEPICSPCVNMICDMDPFCCSHAWDQYCVADVTSVCGESLKKLYQSGMCKKPEGTGGGGGAGGSGGTMTTPSGGGGAGRSGGTGGT